LSFGIHICLSYHTPCLNRSLLNNVHSQSFHYKSFFYDDLVLYKLLTQQEAIDTTMLMLTYWQSCRHKERRKQKRNWMVVSTSPMLELAKVTFRLSIPVKVCKKLLHMFHCKDYTCSSSTLIDMLHHAWGGFFVGDDDLLWGVQL